MSVLDDLLARLREAAHEGGDNVGAKRAEIIASAVTADGADLSSLSDELVQKSASVDVSDEDADYTDEQLAYLQQLAEIGQAVTTRTEEIEAERAAEERRRTARELAQRIAGTKAPVTEEPLDPFQSADGEVTDDTTAGGGGGEGSKELVTASGGKTPAKRVPLGGMRSTGPDRRPAKKNAQQSLPDGYGHPYERVSITASGDGPGVFSGQEFSTITALAAAARDKIQSFARLGSGEGRVGIATLNRHVPSEYLIEDEMRDWQKLEKAADERLLPGGSLVAAMERQRRTAMTAAGVQDLADPIGSALHAWCAPMDILRDWCPLEGAMEGILDLPTITTTKGGVMWPKTPDFADVFKDGPFCFTYEDMTSPVPPHELSTKDHPWLKGDKTLTKEQQEGKDFAKPCVEIPCEVGWEQCILEACSFCIIDNILLSRIDDSLTERAIQQGLFIQRRALNAKRIRQLQGLIDGSAKITAEQMSLHGPGMFESLLSFVSLQVEHLRARKRLARNTTFELVMPAWALSYLVTDLSKKLAINNRWDIGEADVARWLAKRGIRLQLVWEYQDASIAPPAPVKPDDGAPQADKDKYEKDYKEWFEKNKDDLFGGAFIPTAWPEKMKFLLYQAGTFQAIQGPSVTLDAIYDRELLKKNKRVRIFYEDMTCLRKRCGLAFEYEYPLCAGGNSGGVGYNACDPWLPGSGGKPVPPPKPITGPTPGPVPAGAK